MSKTSQSYLGLILILMKHRLSMTVAFSSVVGWFLFTNEISIEILVLFFGTFFLSGGASALNQYQERKLDFNMGRTQKRPIPAGLIAPNDAFLISLVLILSGFTLLTFFTNLPTAFLGLLNVVFYNFLYTPLKTKTQFAVLPGAVVGAIPPMMGWAAAGGALTEQPIIFFATFMFLWQMPHFWLLAIKYREDYERAGFLMLTKKVSEFKVKQLVYFWGFITSLFLMGFPIFFKDSSVLTTILLIVLNFGFIIGFYKILFKPQTGSKSILKAFFFINYYALSVMLVLIGNSFI